MLPRQPLRFLLADDPGAGKTIMAGLLIKELIPAAIFSAACRLPRQPRRAVAGRALPAVPAALRDPDERQARSPRAPATGSPRTNLAIGRLDKLCRNEDVQAEAGSPDSDWDLVVCDEAHKMSATFFGSEVKYTKRYRLGQLLRRLTRHLLLMTATPHNGKPEDFQLFMALLDGDRFEGRFRDGVHTADVLT